MTTFVTVAGVDTTGIFGVRRSLACTHPRHGSLEAGQCHSVINIPHNRAGMVNSALVVFLAGVAIRAVVAQENTTSPNTTETTSTTPSPSGSAVSGESADDKSCSYDGSVT